MVMDDLIFVVVIFPKKLVEDKFLKILILTKDSLKMGNFMDMEHLVIKGE
jgi:hypothetical protein